MRIGYMVLILILSAGVLAAGEKPKQDKTARKEKAVEQTVCPVMGGKINKSVYFDYEGKRIYMCCAGCEGALKKDPAKYIKKLEDAGVVLDKVPEKKSDKEKK